MKASVLTPADEAAAREAFRHLAETNRYWDSHIDELQSRYAGNWVVFLDAKVLAADKDPERVEQALVAMGPSRQWCVVRFVHPPGTEFAF